MTFRTSMRIEQITSFTHLKITFEYTHKAIDLHEILRKGGKTSVISMMKRNPKNC